MISHSLWKTNAKKKPKKTHTHTHPQLHFCDNQPNGTFNIFRLECQQFADSGIQVHTTFIRMRLQHQHTYWIKNYLLFTLFRQDVPWNSAPKSNFFPSFPLQSEWMNEWMNQQSRNQNSRLTVLNVEREIKTHIKYIT